MKAPMDNDNLIARFLAGEAGPEEAMLLEDWKAATTNNNRHYEEMALIYTGANQQQPMARKEAWERLIAEIEGVKTQPGIRRLAVWYAAASIVLCFGFALWLFVGQQSRNTLPVTVNPSGSRKVRLADGSVIQLIGKSDLGIIPGFNRNHRLIRFSGSGTFVVQHHHDHPLIIDMNHFYIKDLGTRFSIQSSANKDTITVSIKEGEVLLGDQASVMKLVAGEDGRYIRSIHQLKKLDNKTRIGTGLPAQIKRKNPHDNEKRNQFEPKPDTDMVIKPVEATKTVVKPIDAIKTVVEPIKPTNNFSRGKSKTTAEHKRRSPNR